jgi:hypothetical protein
MGDFNPAPCLALAIVPARIRGELLCPSEWNEGREARHSPSFAAFRSWDRQFFAKAKADHGVVFFVSPPPAGSVSDSVTGFGA